MRHAQSTYRPVIQLGENIKGRPQRPRRQQRLKGEKDTDLDLSQSTGILKVVYHPVPTLLVQIIDH